MRKIHGLVALGIAVGLGSVSGIASATDGDFDLSFGRSTEIPGTSSVVHGQLGQYDDVATGVALQTDGKVVAVGREIDSAFNMKVFATRLDRQGNVDATFGSLGIGSYEQNPLGGLQLNSESGRAVAIQSDGKIVIAGAAADSATGNTRGLLLRLTATGSIDATFRTGGVVAGLLHTVYNAVAIDPRDDSIIVAGWGTQDGNGQNGKTDRDFYVAHYEKDGGKIGDRFIAFDEGGNNADMAWAVTQAGNRIVLAGQSEEKPYFTTGHQRINCATASVLLPDLQLDPGWGSAFDPGKLTLSFDPYVATHETRDICRAAVTRSDGLVVVGGESFWTFASPDDSSDYSIAIIDSGFIQMRTSNEFALFGDVGNHNGIYGMALQSDDKVVFAGKAGMADPAQAPSNFGFGRLNTDGSIDPTFGPGGAIAPAYDYTLAANAGTAQYATGLVVEKSGPLAVGVNYFWDATSNQPYPTANPLFMKLIKETIFADRFGDVPPVQ